MSQTTQQVENDVREALESGVDIYQRVKEITLKALTERELDIENIKRVVEAALKGVTTGLSSQIEPAKADFNQAVSAIDDVLEQSAQASKLAIEEAISRVSSFSQHDLSQASEDIRSLEQIFLETLEKVTRNSNEMIFDTAQHFIDHARTNGTAVGNSARIVLGTLNDIRHKGQSAALSGASTTASMIAEIAGGILTGLAESFESKKSRR
ncbi:MAG: DUF6781 family protein [Gammaproteobacteria bacterium]